MKKLLLIITLLLSITAGWSGVAHAADNSANAAKNQACSGINSAVGTGSCGGKEDAKTINTVVRGILDILSWVAGIAAVIMVVIAGLKYITSSGDSSAIASAKTSLIYALVGIVVVALAQAIVLFGLHVAKV